MEINNALITKVSFDNERGLSAYLHLSYGNSTAQTFGGHILYAPEGWAAHNTGGDFTGHFIWRVLEIVGVSDWNDLVGKTIRVQKEDVFCVIIAIGNIIEDKWFNPKEEFTKLRSKFVPNLTEE